MSKENLLPAIVSPENKHLKKLVKTVENINKNLSSTVLSKEENNNFFYSFEFSFTKTDGKGEIREWNDIKTKRKIEEQDSLFKKSIDEIEEKIKEKYTKKVAKKVRYFLWEFWENILRYGLTWWDNKIQLIEGESDIELIFENDAKKDSAYALKRQIDILKNEDVEELKEIRNKKMEKGEFTKGGGIGLWLIEVIRKIKKDQWENQWEISIINESQKNDDNHIKIIISIPTQPLKSV